MDGDEAMIVAGVGFRRSAAADEIVALVEQALVEAGLEPARLSRLATLAPLASEAAFRIAARRLAVPPVSIDCAAARDAAPRVQKISARALAAHGVGSVAEAAALAAAGPAARLVLGRIACRSATCALAALPETLA
jgi:cobalt-precorrin 5A hydrolase